MADTKECPVCDGDGEVDCAKCDGPYELGVILDDLLGFDRDPCSICEGSGKVTCSECNGSGRVLDDDD